MEFQKLPSPFTQHRSMNPDHQNHENLIYSPFSLSSTFALLKLGTRGETASQLQTVLHYPEDDTALCLGYQKILQSLDKSNGQPNSKSDGFRFVSANRLYVNKEFQVLETYQQNLTTYFGADKVTVMKLDKGAAVEINEWVKKVTQGKIGDLLDPNSFDHGDGPKLVLVNVVYFRALWENQFNKDDTRPRDFYLSDKKGDKMKVQTMHYYGHSEQGMKLPLTFLQELDADVFALPYRGGRFSMLIYLPKSNTGLKKLEKNLENLPQLSNLFEKMAEKSYRLTIPKFNIESSLDLNLILEKMGVEKVFGSDGDFSGMLAGQKTRFSQSNSVQKAVIIVDEEGTEAAAATGLMVGATRNSPPPVPFLEVNRPFYFQIVDKLQNLVLFAGSVSRPVSPD